ncbi:response regulator [Leptothoe sp. EHU-05/26/07-4]|uniref:Response regulator n=1 Tax=Adonisia turfae CCMR0081 TaxID=2292702 RepID=A0A6M0RL96_9CYAN|nr:response regulator [Adonisia turfae]NEZ56660.1 response regulator [Adonisia turfae CCMR0081]
MKILLVDDDNAISEVLIQQLTVQNYIVDRVADGEMGWSYASTFNYDLILLDWGLPHLDGMQLCQRLRREGYGVPILLLSSRNQQVDKIKGLEAGADDYLVKPFDIKELLVRIRVLVRRTSAEPQPVWGWGDLCLDPASCNVTYQGHPIKLTAKEYALLEFFLRHGHQVFSTSALLDQIWSSDEFPSEATVRSHIRGLRQKLKTAGISADVIETVRGLGYRLGTSPLTSLHHQKLSKTISSERQAQYLQGLTQTWQTHKDESIRRWHYLAHLSQTLKEQDINEQQQLQAKQMAHSLAGTLGIFGLIEGHRLAVKIEQLLDAVSTLSPTQVKQFQALVTTLGHTLDNPPQLVSWTENAPHLPKILIVDVNEASYIQQLMALAVAQGLGIDVATSTEMASQVLGLNDSKTPNLDVVTELPDLVLINLVSSDTDLVLAESNSKLLLQLSTQLNTHWPQLPMVLITPQADFSNRLDLTRRGATKVLEYPVSPAEVLEAIDQATYLRYRHSKIMLVDDDSHYLQQMMELLQPWHLQITPLANAQRFWTIFNQVIPDIIVLDIEMPGINGFDLCKVLRSHPDWQHIPIIFLSVHGDQDSQSKAFAVGADDYITKLTQGQNLVFRILNRLRRYHAWCNQENIALALE